ncbi:hypothetical protein BGI40_02055 [Snodgrassella communis]|uniref:hypothetical protein n=1 Tax=Snodgrassella communis TaxID=2946699 RepID=UPI000C1F008A|nr:hypothetical protein [Snodgrassella communis]PIT10414.1 hypothetical protein BGI29_05595 [Snodgrassella communis]PIT26889.1 hypothetical protein BGI38_07065 [Snodgrassella communis]PIT29692.1 hypothetical protein BGI39_01725 [Snodgrassella communis]PIT35672.1 hypothetical protein BGI40_02055 [Snodgrassella communis]
MFDQFLDFISGRWFWIPAIFFFGIFLIYLGKRRLRSEAQPDPRYDLIPDEDVKKFWRWMSEYNICLSKFYIYFWGPFLIIFAIINFLMLLVFNAMTDDLMSIEQIVLFIVFICLSYYLSESASIVRGGYSGGGSNVSVNKSAIIDIYKCINFRSKEEKEWIIKNLKPPIGELKNFYRQQINILKGINYIPYCWVIGRSIWFITWSVFFIYFTIQVYLHNF